MTEPSRTLRANKFASGADAAQRHPDGNTPSQPSDDAMPVQSHHKQPSAIPGLPNAKDEELWSIKTVSQKTGLSRASIYRYIAKGFFPPRRRIGPGRTAWLASEVVYWMHSRPRPEAP